MKHLYIYSLALALAGAGAAVAGPPAGQTDRYLIPDVTSHQGGTAVPRIISLLQITVRNNGGQPCNVSVRFEYDGGIAYCSLGVAGLAAGRAYTFCTRNVDFMALNCDFPTCEAQTGASLFVGRGLIASTSGTACGKLAVEAQRYHLYQPSSGAIEFRGVTPARFVKAGGASSGD